MALPQQYPVVTFTATADPYDARVGSGGGTVAALTDHITIHNEEDDDGTTTTVPTTCLPATVLILHAGGAASRCPTQMCLGKAWTSLPSLGSGSLLYTPLQVWLDQCQRIFGSDGTKGKSTLPRGSVVVVATDTLLQLMDPDDNGTDFASLDWSTELRDRDVVLGLAVPAPLSTAKNHGVFVPDNHTDTVSSRTGSIRIESCRAVLQKPSIEDMTSTAGCCFMADPATSFQSRRTIIIRLDRHGGDDFLTLRGLSTIIRFHPTKSTTLYRQRIATALPPRTPQQQSDHRSS